MKKHVFYEGLWHIKHIRNGKIISEEETKNILVDEGEKAIVDTFFRKNASSYFSADKFYIGLYKGTVSESTVLSTIPNEPSGNGYSRIECERSNVGWPTLEQDEGDWQVISKELSLTAVGGNIGPVNGAFLGTSLDDFGVLIGAIAMKIERTIVAGDTIIFQLTVKLK